MPDSCCCRYPTSAKVEQLINLESLLPNGQKKVPKVYQIACHPLQPHLVAVAANAGTCFCIVHIACVYAHTIHLWVDDRHLSYSEALPGDCCGHCWYLLLYCFHAACWSQKP